MRIGLVMLSLVGLLVGGLTTERRPIGAPVAQAADDFAYGVIVDTTNPRSMRLAREAGFTHAKMIVHWPRLEPRRGRYTFQETHENDLDNVVKVAKAENVKLVVRVDGVPDWAGGAPAKVKADIVEAFYAALARHAKGAVVGYEILNEPNLPSEWGGSPSPSGYVELVKAAYRGVKRGDPNALIIAGGPSPNTGGFGGTVEDVDFLRGMYAAGVRGHLDVLAVHNYGGNFEPERSPTDCGICFRRAELYRQIMVENGDSKTPIWGTEFGWLMDPGRNMGQYDWMKVSAEQQADFIVRAYRYGRQSWPWLGGLLLSNLDASTSPYHTSPGDGMPWFAILNEDHSPRPAYRAFKRMREQSADVTSRSTPTPSPTPEPTATPEPAPSSLSSAPPATSPPPVTAEAEPAVVVTATPAPPAPERVRVSRTAGDGVSLRAAPSTTAARLAILPEGAVLEVIGQDRQADGRVWRHVRGDDGQIGWVAGEYLTPVP